MAKVMKKKHPAKTRGVEISELDMDLDLQPNRFSPSMTQIERCQNAELMKPLGMDHFDDDSTTASTDMMMMVPQQDKNFMVLSTELQNAGSSSSDPFNLANFNSSLGGQSNIVALEQGTTLFYGLFGTSGLRCAGVCLLFFLLFFPWTTALLVAVIVLLLMRSHSGSKPSKRTIKWTIQDFSEEIRGGFLTSPSFFDKTGQWRLVVRQKRCIDGVQTTFGLISTDIPPELEFVTATIKFSCTNQLGHEVSPGMKDLKFSHKFECSGDCGYTRPFMFCRRQLGDEDTINIHCRIDFRKVEVGYFQYLVLAFSKNAKDAPGKRKGRNCVQEFGTVRSETLVYQTALSVQIRPLTRFLQHEETRMFVWEIPNFNMLMQNTECWGLFSPQFFVNSHDFCSIWRMKILELHGVFRLHVQLRGLPRGVKQIKLWYLLQLVDNFGDSVVPEHSICRVKYPDHLNLWDTTRHILYRRETMLERFTSSDGTLALRLSLHLEPNDLALLETDSDEWIRLN